MRHLRRASVILLSALAGVASAPAPAGAAGPGDTILVSGPAGLAAPTPSLFAWNISGATEEEDRYTTSGMSANGQVVVFTSEADDLAATAADRPFDQVFVKDRVTGTLTDVTSGANAPSSYPSISDDGLHVAFVSRATNLTAADPYDDPDVFVKDLPTGTVKLVSNPTDESSSGACPYINCGSPQISGNGQYVVMSTPSALLPADANGRNDVYRVRISDGDTKLVSRRNGLTTPSVNGQTFLPTISDDGRFVAFLSTASDLVASDPNTAADAFVTDVSTATSIRVSGKSNSTATTAAGTVYAAFLSGDGHWLTYNTTSTDVGGDVADADPTSDTYRRQVTSGVPALLATAPATVMSRATGGAKANGASTPAGISDDGSKVLFVTGADNLGDTGSKPYLRNVALATTVSVVAAAGATSAYATSLSGDGTTVGTTSSDPLTPGAPPEAFYVTPAGGGPSELLTHRPGQDAAQPQLTDVQYAYYDGAPQQLSAGGRYVVFSTTSPSLTNGRRFDQQVFRRDLRTGDVVRVSRTSTGVPADGDLPSISADGTKVAFRSDDRLVPDDGDSNSDAYVADLADPASPVITLASRGGVGDVKSDFYISSLQLSADGGRVLFITGASNLGAVSHDHVYVRTLATSSTVIADRAPGEAGAIGDGDADRATISADGTKVAFQTVAANLGDGDADGSTDIHLRDLAAATTTLVSRADGDAGAKGNGGSYVPVISGDGRSVAFRSDATNLDVTTPIGMALTQGFVRDLATGRTRLVSRVGAAGTWADTSVGPMTLSADGAIVAYTLSRPHDGSSNVSPAAPPRSDAIVVRTLATGAQQTILAGGAADPTQSSMPQGFTVPSLSADGRCLSFVGRGTDIVPGVSPDFTQQFVRVLAGDCATVAPTPGPGPGPGGGGPGPGPELTPVISALSVSNKAFRVGAKATAKIAAVAKKKHRAPVGTTFRYTLSAPAATGITIQRRTKGRKVGATCKKATKALARRKPCTRFVKVMALTRGARPAGKVQVAFSGRVGKVKLQPGSYRALLVAVGTGPGKRRSQIRQVTFTVVR